jgi:hypothetical protein
MTAREHIKIFVQETLGCGCPEEVFESIDCRNGVSLEGRVALDACLTIGNRLLIYVVSTGMQGKILEFFPFLVRAGKKERDARGLNRFRLVIVCDDEQERKALHESFAKIEGKDDKIHLHLISRKDNLFS